MSATNWTFITSKQVWMDRSLSPEAKVIWHILSAYRSHKTGEAHPKVWTLQQVSGLGRGKVRSAIAELTKAGAITKRTIKWRGAHGMDGSKCVYTVGKLSAWVGKDIYEAPPEEKREEVVSGRVTNRPSTNDPVTVSHSETLNHNKTVSLYRHPSMAENAGLRLTETEIEDLVADRGLGASVASVVWERLSSAGWLDAAGLPFRSRKQIEGYAAGLAEDIDEARTSSKPGW